MLVSSRKMLCNVSIFTHSHRNCISQRGEHLRLNNPDKEVNRGLALFSAPFFDSGSQSERIALQLLLFSCLGWETMNV